MSDKQEAINHVTAALAPHEFEDMPGKSLAVDDNPHETVMLLRCRWCYETPSKARADGCPTHELVERGCIRLSQFNPKGLDRFLGRKCITCNQEIMGHWLIALKDSSPDSSYWCDRLGTQASQGIDITDWDMPEGFGQETIKQDSKLKLIGG